MWRKRSFAETPGREAAFEIVADGLADPEPGLPGGQRIQQVGGAETARGAVQRPGAAGMRVRAGHYGAGQRIGVLGDDDMADPLIRPDIVDAPDAEAPRELAAPRVHRRRRAVRGRHVVIEHDDDLVGVVHLQHLAPRPLPETEIDHHDEIDIDDREVARRDRRRAAFPRQDFFDDRHAHRNILPRGGTLRASHLSRRLL